VSVVLGIDAAWTTAQPSGVALVRSHGRKWECVAIAPSYSSFLALARGEPVDWRARPAAGIAACSELVEASTKLAGAAPDVIAIDMPLATKRITGRREADNAITRAYVSRGLGVHTPTETRPGPIADLMRTGFAAQGYRVATASTKPGTPRVLIEAFPHAAAIVLAGASYRVPYKLSRAAQYWPDATSEARRRALLAKWGVLRRALASQIRGGTLRVPSTGPMAALKRYEDALDALICAWIGTEYLAGRLRAHGDTTAAVWAH
jgi:predicted RNase H-like nuclease